LERQGADMPGDVGLSSLVAWRPALSQTTWQARAGWPLGINIDDIARRGIVIASALLRAYRGVAPCRRCAVGVDARPCRPRRGAEVAK
jgi:hypothetical protein